MNTCLDYVSIKSEINNYTNFLTKPLALLYLKNYTKDARNFGVTLQKLFKKIETDSINNLIIDLRYNSGGDERTGKQLIWYLTDNTNIDGFTNFLLISDYLKQVMKIDFKKDNKKYQEKYGIELPNGEINITEKIYDQPYFFEIEKENSPYILDKSIQKFTGNIYVLIGKSTFSAAQILATTMFDNNIGLFIGKPTGNKPTGQTGASGFKLPHSKSLINLSLVYMERPDTSKNNMDALYPDVSIFPKLEQLINGEDVQFEYIMNQIKHN
jgi:C-terminal processing protease CtpA/Prc